MIYDKNKIKSHYQLFIHIILQNIRITYMIVLKFLKYYSKEVYIQYP